LVELEYPLGLEWQEDSHLFEGNT